MRNFFLSLALPWLIAGCTTPEHHAEDAAYAAQMQLITVENSKLRDALLEIASDSAQTGGLTGAGKNAFKTQVVPLQEHILLQAKMVTAPPRWEGHHQELIGLLERRARAYHTLAESSDANARQQAQAEATQVSLEEGRWYSEVGLKLGQPKRSFSQFP